MTRKTVSRVSVVLYLLSTLCLFNHSVAVKAETKVWLVEKGNPEAFQTIQAAIDNASVKAGDTILVANGTYVENVIVSKSVSIIGENPYNTTVEGDDNDDVFSILARFVTVSNLTIRSGQIRLAGISIESTSYDNVISHNRIIGHAIGIDLRGHNNIVRGNNMSDNSFYAVFITSSGNVLSDNMASNNDNGFYLQFCTYNRLESNTVHSNTGYGITLAGSSQNLVSDSTLQNNSVGIFAVNSYNNSIYHNNFVNNTASHIISTAQPNNWDNGFEGNYWSDYNGTDLYRGPYQNETGSDGIADRPHFLEQEGNEDRFPLMDFLHDFTVTSQGKEYHVTLVSNSTISGFKYNVGLETGNKIIVFNVITKAGTGGFCRTVIPNELMRYPYIMLTDSEEMVPVLLATSNQTSTYLYFTYPRQSQTITIISSRVQSRYDELLANYLEVRANLTALDQAFNDLLADYQTVQGQLAALLEDYLALQGNLTTINATHNLLLMNYTMLTGQFSVLNRSYTDLSDSYVELQANLTAVSGSYGKLVEDNLLLTVQFATLNDSYKYLSTSYATLNESYGSLSNSFMTLQTSYSSLSASYASLQDKYTRLLADFNMLDTSYRDHLASASQQAQNLQNMTYLLAFITAVFIATAIYLSKSAHERRQRIGQGT